MVSTMASKGYSSEQRWKDYGIRIAQVIMMHKVILARTLLENVRCVYESPEVLRLKQMHTMTLKTVP